MTQDPSDRAPSDPTAAPGPDSEWAPPPSSAPPDAPAGAPATTSGGPSGNRPGTPDPSGESTQVIDTSAATPYAGYDPARFSGGAGSRGYGAPSYGQQAEAAAYGDLGAQPGPPPVGQGYGYPPPGYGGYGGYGAPGYGYAPAYAPPPTNTMAILSLVFAFVFAPAGIVFGFIARKQIRETGEQGDGIALAGLIISIAFVALFLLFIILPLIFLFAGAAGSLG